MFLLSPIVGRRYIIDTLGILCILFKCIITIKEWELIKLYCEFTMYIKSRIIY